MPGDTQPDAVFRVHKSCDLAAGVLAKGNFSETELPVAIIETGHERIGGKWLADAVFTKGKSRNRNLVGVCLPRRVEYLAAKPVIGVIPFAQAFGRGHPQVAERVERQALDLAGGQCGRIGIRRAERNATFAVKARQPVYCTEPDKTLCVFCDAGDHVVYQSVVGGDVAEGDAFGLGGEQGSGREEEEEGTHDPCYFFQKAHGESVFEKI